MIKKLKTIGITLAIVFLSISSRSLAQGLMIGVKAGINLANVAMNQNEFGPSVKKPVLGINAGGIFNIGLSKTFSIQPEINFSQKGVYVEYDEDLTYYQAKLIMNYMEMPILLKATFGAGAFRAFVNAGPYAGYWMGGKVHTTYYFTDSGEWFDETYSYSLSDIESWLDLGVAIGAGCSYNLGRGTLFLEGRYGLGLLGIDGDIKNRVLGISTGCALKLGRK